MSNKKVSRKMPGQFIFNSALIRFWIERKNRRVRAWLFSYSLFEWSSRHDPKNIYFSKKMKLANIAWCVHKDKRVFFWHSDILLPFLEAGKNHGYMDAVIINWTWNRTTYEARLAGIQALSKAFGQPSNLLEPIDEERQSDQNRKQKELSNV